MIMLGLRELFRESLTLRLYESVFFDTLQDKKPVDFLNSLKERLTERRMDFLEINSEKHGIKLHKEQADTYPIYLKNKCIK